VITPIGTNEIGNDQCTSKGQKGRMFSIEGLDQLSRVTSKVPVLKTKDSKGHIQA
jgi:hypothetical protein